MGQNGRSPDMGQEMDIDRTVSSPIEIFRRLFIIFVSGMSTVFGVLIFMMLVFGEGFEFDAFAYRAFRALMPLIVATFAGIAVINRHWAIRALFGSVVGFVLAYVHFYLTY